MPNRINLNIPSCPVTHAPQQGVRITFGLIVLNGEPFTRYNLRSLYPWAHQIIVVEGACPAAAHHATSDGHSQDDTLFVIRQFMKEEDPKSKVILVVAEDEGHTNGFWSEKDEMSQAYAKRASGDYLWQVDVDEFYTEETMRQIVEYLSCGEWDTVSFPVRNYWGQPDFRAEGFLFVAGNGGEAHRIFRWSSGYVYKKHRPPTVVDDAGVDLRSKHWLRASTLRRRSLFMEHYSLLFPHQVTQKAAYYSQVHIGRVNWSDFSHLQSWVERCYANLGNPFRVLRDYHQISWLMRSNALCPLQVSKMWQAVLNGEHPQVARRNCTDIDILLSRLDYRVATAALLLLAYCVRPFLGFYDGMKNRLGNNTLYLLVKQALAPLIKAGRRAKLRRIEKTINR